MQREDLLRYSYHPGQGFFGLDSIKSLIESLAGEHDLTVFVGAGASVAFGLPTWNELLRSLLTEVADKDGRVTGKDQSAVYVNAILENYDSLAAASVLRARLPQQKTFRERVHASLYSHHHENAQFSDRSSEGFAEAVWRLYLLRRKANKRTSIVTLNFDDTLEAVFARSPKIAAEAAALGITSASPVYTNRTLEASLADGTTVPIFHLHGYLPKEGSATCQEHRLILSTADYTGIGKNHWSNKVLDGLRNSRWLLSGMSFQDPHINTILSRRPSDMPPTAVFTTQGRPWFGLNSATTMLLAEAEQTRLAELNVLAVIGSFFFQEAIFLEEIGRQSSAGAIHYSSRTDIWKAWFTSKARLDEPLRTRIRKQLTKLRDDLESALPIASQREQLKIELWMRDFGDRRVTLWISTEAKFVDHTRSPSFLLRVDSEIAAVKALTHGAFRPSGRPDAQENAWKSFNAYPIRLGGGDADGVPVGAVVVGSSHDLALSGLTSQRSDFEDMVWASLPAIVVKLSAMGV